MIFLILSTVCVGTVVGVNEAEMPKYSVGDKWKVTVDYKGEIGMLGTLTYEITGDSVEINQFGEDYECYEYEMEGGGTVYGAVYWERITGTWTMEGKMYIQKSDLSDVKSTLTTDATFTSAGISMTMHQLTETTYNPPRELYKGLPATAGKSWSAATTETTTTQTTTDGEFEEETEATTNTYSIMVVRTESITVSAGEFDTFVIRTISPDGSYFETWYSPETGSGVKETEYDATGKIVGTTELLEYRYAAAAAVEEFPWLLVIIGIVIAAAVIVGGVGYVLYKRRKPPVPVAPTPPTEEPTPPSASQ